MGPKYTDSVDSSFRTNEKRYKLTEIAEFRKALMNIYPTLNVSGTEKSDLLEGKTSLWEKKES